MPSEVEGRVGETVPLAPAASVPPVKLTVPAPAKATLAGMLLVRLPGVETTNPEGNASVKPIPVSVPTAFGLVIVKLRLVVPPTPIKGAANILLIIGSATTVMVEVDVLPVP